jgi:hypothetical protein
MTIKIMKMDLKHPITKADEDYKADPQFAYFIAGVLCTSLVIYAWQMIAGVTF